MLEYRCPDCNRKAFEAGAFVRVHIELKCPGCKRVVSPEPRGRPKHVEYECARCHRHQHIEMPVCDRTYCIACGTETLVIVGGERERVKVLVRANGIAGSIPAASMSENY